MGGKPALDEHLASLLEGCDRAMMLKTLASVEKLFARSHTLLSKLSAPERAFMREWAAEGADPLRLARHGENVAAELAGFFKDDKAPTCREGVHCEMPETDETTSDGGIGDAHSRL